MKEEGNPFSGISVVGSRPAAEFVSAVAVPDELSVTERGDDADIAVAVDAVEVHFHGHNLKGAVS